MEEQSPPNIIFITVDALRADFVGFQNPNERNTPFLDTLSSKSYVFKNAIVPSVPTYFCFPSIMTGQLPFKYGNFLGIPNKSGIKTIAEVLKENNYFTAAFIADNPLLYDIYGYDRGFDYFFNGSNAEEKKYKRLGRLITYIKKRAPVYLKVILKSCFYDLIKPPKLPITGEGLNRRVKAFSSKRLKRPFFLWIHYMDVHRPYFSGLDSHFEIEKNRLKNTIAKAKYYKRERLWADKVSSHELKILKEAYRSSIKYVDESLQEIYLFFKNTFSNTVFIVTSDHGECFQEHGELAHKPSTLYSELIRVPLIIEVPGLHTKTIEKTVSLVSLPKTICSLASVKADGFFDGNDIVGEINLDDINNVSKILHGCYFPRLDLQIFDSFTEITGFRQLLSYTCQEYKYIMDEDGQREEFYDLKADPEEQNNIINNSNINDERTRAKRILQKYA